MTCRRHIPGVFWRNQRRILFRYHQGVHPTDWLVARLVKWIVGGPREGDDLGSDIHHAPPPPPLPTHPQLCRNRVRAVTAEILKNVVIFKIPIRLRVRVWWRWWLWRVWLGVRLRSQLSISRGHSFIPQKYVNPQLAVRATYGSESLVCMVWPGFAFRRYT